MDPADLKSCGPAPIGDLVQRLSLRILRAIPVEVDVYVFFEVKVVVPVQLREVPVDKALHVLPTRFDTKYRHVLLDVHGYIQCGEVSGKRCQRPHRGPRLIFSQASQASADQVVGKLSHWRLTAVDVKVELASGR